MLPLAVAVQTSPFPFPLVCSSPVCTNTSVVTGEQIVVVLVVATVEVDTEVVEVD